MAARRTTTALGEGSLPLGPGSSVAAGPLLDLGQPGPGDALPLAGEGAEGYLRRHGGSIPTSPRLGTY